MPNLKDLLKLNPVTIKAQLTKWAAIMGVGLALLVGAYMYGRHDGKVACTAALNKVAAAVAQQRGNNAIDAGKRFGEYVKDDAELAHGINDLIAQVEAHYAKPQEPLTVEVTKLIPVPGQKELVYVPSDSCPGTVLDADELRLFNQGNKRDDLDASDSQ